MLALVAFGVGAAVFEGSARVWAMILLRETFRAPSFVESAVAVALAVSMAGGRLLADRWVDVHGPRRVAFASLAVALVGLAVVTIAGGPLVAIAGFTLGGFGTGIITPLMLSSAARLGDRPASENVAAATFAIQLAMLAAPAMIGVVAEAAGVRVAFAAMAPLVAVGLAMVRRLR